MSVERPIIPAVARATQLRIRVALIVAVAAMMAQLCRLLIEGVLAIRSPWGIDYGEGIVWEQMRLMVAGRGYGAIDGLPAIVFHYPPVYHIVTAAISAISGLDPLAAGRSVALGSTLLMGLFVGLIVATAIRSEAAPRTVVICGLIAGLATFCFMPLAEWSMLMRVDMLSFAFGLAGLLTAMLALKRPVFMIGSVFLFVAAVYTKQVSIVAPAAVFLTFLVVRPKLAWLLAAGCTVLGLVVLTGLQLATDGGFARHIFLYNVNRIDPSRLVAVAGAISTHLLYSFAVFAGVTLRLKQRWPHYRGAGSISVLRARLLASPGDTFFLLILVYAVLAGLMSLTIVKSGSNVNYFIEAMVVCAILIGIVARDSVEAAFGVGRAPVDQRRRSHPLFLPLMLAIQAVIVSTSSRYDHLPPGRETELEQLRGMIAVQDRPVISDDMVLLIRAGVSVPWEPAIFAELAKTGAWDEVPFVERIRARQFAFFITVGGRGDRRFDERYNPAVADAMSAAYPVKRVVAGYLLHLPANPTR